MSEVNKSLIRRWGEEGFNKGNVALADELYDANVLYHEPAAGELRGLDALKRFVSSWLTAFPDAQLRIEQQIAENDRVATRWTFTGTHRGNFRGIAPTGKRITMGAMYFYRVANGKIVEIRAMVDTLGLLRQMGAVPVSSPSNERNSPS
jgi:steroid delta-isomerase-like uncharacterized protein